MQLYDSNTDDYGKDFELTPWEVDWIINGSKVPADYDPFGRKQLKLANEANERADKLIAELHAMLDPFDADDIQPECEPEYDEYQEWQDMTSQLRRGEG